MPVDRVTELVQEGLRRKLTGDPAGAAEAWELALGLDPGNARASAYLEALRASGALAGAVTAPRSNPFARPSEPPGVPQLALTPGPFKLDEVAALTPLSLMSSGLPAPRESADRIAAAPAAPAPEPTAGAAGLEMPWPRIPTPLTSGGEAKENAGGPQPPFPAPPPAPSPWTRIDPPKATPAPAAAMAFGGQAAEAGAQAAAGEIAGWSLPDGASCAPPLARGEDEAPAKSTLMFGAGMAPPAASALPLPGPEPTAAAPEPPAAAPEPPPAVEVVLEAPVDEVGLLLTKAIDLLDLDDHSGALEAAEKVLSIDSSNATARELVDRCQATLLAMYESKIGDVNGRPRILMRPDEIVWLSLDHRAGFVLSMIDGQVSYDDLFVLSSMSRLETARILAKLLGDRVIG